MEVPSRFEIDDELWAEVKPLTPTRPRRRRYPGRKPLPDRLVLNGILHVLHTGIAWEDLPQEYGYGSGVTAWRRLRDWQKAGVWDALHQKLLEKLNAAGAIDWSRAAVDGGHVRALLGAPDRGIPGRSRPQRLKAPSPGQRDGDPAGRVVDGRGAQRRHPAAATAGRPPRPPGGGQRRPASPEARPRRRRPRL